MEVLKHSCNLRASLNTLAPYTEVVPHFYLCLFSRQRHFWRQKNLFKKRKAQIHNLAKRTGVIFERLSVGALTIPTRTRCGCKMKERRRKRKWPEEEEDEEEEN